MRFFGSPAAMIQRSIGIVHPQMLVLPAGDRVSRHRLVRLSSVLLRGDRLLHGGPHTITAVYSSRSAQALRQQCDALAGSTKSSCA